MLIVDTDILSMFAKVNALHLLVELVGQDQIGMTPAIADEIAIPLQYGYSFPVQVLASIPVVPLEQSVVEACVRLQPSTRTIGRGEREAIAFCQETGAWFATNDALARQVAQSQGIQVISLQALLRTLWRSGLRSKDEIRRLLDQIKEADHLKVSAETEREIFREETVNEDETHPPSTGQDSSLK